MKTTLVAMCLIFGSNAAFGQGSACIDQAGKKVFSDMPCEKRGLQAAKPDFPITSKDTALPVFVVPNADTPATRSHQISKVDTPNINRQEKRVSPWSGDRPLTGIAWFIISLMPIAAVLFLGFNLLLIIKKRLRKDRHVRSSMQDLE